MIKVLLGVSIVLNLVLSWFLFNRKPEKEVIERVIIETHAQDKPKVEVQEKVSSLPPATVKTENKDKKEPVVMTQHDPREVQDAGERMESERMEFMTQELGMSEEKIAEHNRLRNEFFKKTAEFWQKNPMKELSFKERRKLIDLEEELHRNLEALHGKKNWQKYQKFRESYNQRGFKKQMEENRPFLFMPL